MRSLTFVAILLGFVVLLNTAHAADESKAVASSASSSASVPTMRLLEEEDAHSDHDESWTKKDAWSHGIGATIVVCAMSLIGMVFLVASSIDASNYMIELLSFAAGTLIGAATLSLMPETSELLGSWTKKVSAVFLGGILCGWAIESTFHFVLGHGHVHEHQEHEHGQQAAGPKSIELQQAAPAAAVTVQVGPSVQVQSSPGARDGLQMAIVNLVADGLHNFVDGVLIGATFLSSKTAGWKVAAAIIVHELPQELSDFAVLKRSGFSTCAVLLANLACSLTAIVGAVVALAVGEHFEEDSAYVLPFAAGIFIFLSLGGILPEVDKLLHCPRTEQQQQRWWFAARLRSVVLFGLGIGVMALLMLMPGHEHGHAEEAAGAH